MQSGSENSAAPSRAHVLRFLLRKDDDVITTTILINDNCTSIFEAPQRSSQSFASNADRSC